MIFEKVMLKSKGTFQTQRCVIEHIGSKRLVNLWYTNGYTEEYKNTKVSKQGFLALNNSCIIHFYLPK